eukprot:CAMPEP_0204905708 /NCGR_PEP_ID=MMETSP1397-20131031/5573_1 /ASSEMBLY_ACC=CAM_ASM_000891 /TAXON_ID=49980 /ORGANISM="Climacostomum Climacostomum virens, Strain Stock W-24" /LENGTH=97 /DNA_ID=CAMNT_0052074621 /DNA_START=448 /DNA_END=737 /DNA_ORIENTATION=-
MDFQSLQLASPLTSPMLAHYLKLPNDIGSNHVSADLLDRESRPAYRALLRLFRPSFDACSAKCMPTGEPGGVVIDILTNNAVEISTDPFRVRKEPSG